MGISTVEQNREIQDPYSPKNIHKPKEIFDLPDKQRELFEQGVKEIESLPNEGLFKPLSVQQFDDKILLLEEASAAIIGTLKKLNYKSLEEYLAGIVNGCPAEFLKSINWYGQKIIENPAKESLKSLLGRKSFPPGVVSNLEFNVGCFLVCKTLKEYEDNPFTYVIDFYRNGVVLPGFANYREGGKQVNFITTSSFIKGLDKKLISGRLNYIDTEGKIDSDGGNLMPLEDLYNYGNQSFPLPSISRIIAHQRNQG